MIQYLQFVDGHLFSILVMITLIISIIIKKKGFSQTTTFILLLCASSILILFLDFIPWLYNGKPGIHARNMIILFDTFYFIFHPIVPIIWLCYVDLISYGSMERLKKRLYYIYPVIISLCLTLFSLKNGFVFYVDNANVYHRALGTYILTCMDWLIIVYAVFITLKNRHKVQFRVQGISIAFTLIPFVGSLINILFENTSIIFPLVSLSIVFTYFFLEIRNDSRDYLTGLLNRQQIDNWIQYRMNKYSKQGSFSMVVIDMNGFKLINDNYGHHVGDQALIHLSTLLSDSVKHTDKVGRFGGDEFIIIIEMGEEKVINQLMWRIMQKLDKENLARKEAFMISFSYGYAIYRPEWYKSHNEIFAAADKMMYENKMKEKSSLKTLS